MMSERQGRSLWDDVKRSAKKPFETWKPKEKPKNPSPEQGGVSSTSCTVASGIAGCSGASQQAHHDQGNVPDQTKEKNKYTAENSVPVSLRENLERVPHTVSPGENSEPASGAVSHGENSEPVPEAPVERGEEEEPRNGLDLAASFRTPEGRVFSFTLGLTERCFAVGAVVGGTVLWCLARILYQCLELVIHTYIDAMRNQERSPIMAPPHGSVTMAPPDGSVTMAPLDGSVTMAPPVASVITAPSDVSETVALQDGSETMCNLLCKAQAQETVSKLLSSLLEDDNALECICACLDAQPVHFEKVALYYRLYFYEIIEFFKIYDGSPTIALIEWLAATHPNLTVQEFATVVENNTGRIDVSQRLIKYAYDLPEDCV